MNITLLDPLIRACGSFPIVESEVDAIRRETGWSRERFCDEFARDVAHGYAAGRLCFTAANAAMKRLYAFGYGNSRRMLPAFSWDVYQAFDDGEYRHCGDPDDVDPELKYTRPQILSLVGSELEEALAPELISTPAKAV